MKILLILVCMISIPVFSQYSSDPEMNETMSQILSAHSKKPLQNLIKSVLSKNSSLSFEQMVFQKRDCGLEIEIDLVFHSETDECILETLIGDCELEEFDPLKVKKLKDLVCESRENID